MRSFLIVTLGLYAALGPLCPMQLAAASAAMSDAPMMSVASSMHDIDAHDVDLQCTAVQHQSSCGESEHCTLGETVDSAGADTVQEVPATCFVNVTVLPLDTISQQAIISTQSMNRPPPLSLLATVVQLQ